MEQAKHQIIQQAKQDNQLRMQPVKQDNQLRMQPVKQDNQLRMQPVKQDNQGSKMMKYTSLLLLSVLSVLFVPIIQNAHAQSNPLDQLIGGIKNLTSGAGKASNNTASQAGQSRLECNQSSRTINSECNQSSRTISSKMMKYTSLLLLSVLSVLFVPIIQNAHAQSNPLDQLIGGIKNLTSGAGKASNNTASQAGQSANQSAQKAGQSAQNATSQAGQSASKSRTISRMQSLKKQDNHFKTLIAMLHLTLVMLLMQEITTSAKTIQLEGPYKMLLKELVIL